MRIKVICDTKDVMINWKSLNNETSCLCEKAVKCKLCVCFKVQTDMSLVELNGSAHNCYHLASNDGREASLLSKPVSQTRMAFEKELVLSVCQNVVRMKP